MEYDSSGALNLLSFPWRAHPPRILFVVGIHSPGVFVTGVGTTLSRGSRQVAGIACSDPSPHALAYTWRIRTLPALADAFRYFFVDAGGCVCLCRSWLEVADSAYFHCRRPPKNIIFFPQQHTRHARSLYNCASLRSTLSTSLSGLWCMLEHNHSTVPPSPKPTTKSC